ncbi:MAG: hypothetical protein OXD01_09120 [Gammaproteobacteria bacterium]|nr:hypothetical protein [Gammaproteobacteria bacterium]
MLFQDDDREGAKARRTSPVQPAQTSTAAQRKSARKTTAEGLPAYSLSTLLEDLSTLVLNKVHLPGSSAQDLIVATEVTPLQDRAFELLKVQPDKMFSVDLQI